MGGYRWLPFRLADFIGALVGLHIMNLLAWLLSDNRSFVDHFTQFYTYNFVGPFVGLYMVWYFMSLYIAFSAGIYIWKMESQSLTVRYARDILSFVIHSFTVMYIYLLNGTVFFNFLFVMGWLVIYSSNLYLFYRFEKEQFRKIFADKDYFSRWKKMRIWEIAGILLASLAVGVLYIFTEAEFLSTSFSNVSFRGYFIVLHLPLIIYILMANYETVRSIRLKFIQEFSVIIVFVILMNSVPLIHIGEIHTDSIFWLPLVVYLSVKLVSFHMVEGNL